MQFISLTRSASLLLLRQEASSQHLLTRRCYAYVKDPGTLKNRLFRAVTQPIFPMPQPSEADKFNEIEQRKLKKLQHPYRQFLLRRCIEDLFEASAGGQLIAMHFVYYKFREMQPTTVKLHKLGFRLISFPHDLILDAAANTKWESFARVIMQPNTKYILSKSADPQLTLNALALLKKLHFMFVIGGIVGHRIMNVDELQQYAQLPSDHKELLAQTMGNLQLLPQITSQLLDQPAQQLSFNLQSLHTNDKQ